MARTIFCKLDRFHNTDVNVDGSLYHIGEDGIFVVDNDEHAAELLNNKAKYEEAEEGHGGAAPAPKPGQRPKPQPILVDKSTRRELTPQETTAVLEKEQAKAVEPAKEAEAKPKSEPAPKDVKPEPAPSEWPDVSMASTKKELLAVATKLKKAGAKIDVGDKATKTDLLESIERAYEKME